MGREGPGRGVRETGETGEKYPLKPSFAYFQSEGHLTGVRQSNFSGQATRVSTTSVSFDFAVAFFGFVTTPRIGYSSRPLVLRTVGMIKTI